MTTSKALPVDRPITDVGNISSLQVCSQTAAAAVAGQPCQIAVRQMSYL